MLQYLVSLNFISYDRRACLYVDSSHCLYLYKIVFRTFFCFNTYVWFNYKFHKKHIYLLHSSFVFRNVFHLPISFVPFLSISLLLYHLLCYLSLSFISLSLLFHFYVYLSICPPSCTSLFLLSPSFLRSISVFIFYSYLSTWPPLFIFHLFLHIQLDVCSIFSNARYRHNLQWKSLNSIKQKTMLLLPTYRR